MIETENTAEKKENAADVCAAECAAEIKAGIRKQMRAMRRALDAEAVREASFAVAEKVRALPEFNSAGLLMAYMPAKNELDPMPLIECAKAAGKRIAFPLCIENGGLRLFVPNNGADSFVSGSYGILEPKPEDSNEVFAEDIDLIIVPAVAFTKECGRLGQGGGYYDRLLKKTGAFTVGVGYDFQLCESLPVEEHDMPLDCVALPGALFKKG